MTPAEMAALHRVCFTGKLRPWTATEFAEMADDPSIRILTAPGHGQALMTALEAAARASDVEDIFLDVAEDNAAAIALYRKTGFAEAGYRRDYYSRTNAERVCARRF